MNLSKHEPESISRKFAKAAFPHLERDKHFEQFLQVQETLAVSKFQGGVGANGAFNSKLQAFAAVQHFGGVTRLLDVISTAFVALCFAFAEGHYAFDGDDNERLKPKAIFAFRSMTIWTETISLFEQWLESTHSNRVACSVRYAKP